MTLSKPYSFYLLSFEPVNLIKKLNSYAELTDYSTKISFINAFYKLINHLITVHLLFIMKYFIQLAIIIIFYPPWFDLL